jgi:hypothetical protein
VYVCVSCRGKKKVVEEQQANVVIAVQEQQANVVIAVQE